MNISYDKETYDTTPSKEHQLIWVQEALIQDGFEKMSISSSQNSYFKEVRENVAIVVNLDDGKHDISFLAFGKRVDEDKDGMLASVATLIAEAMDGQLPTQNNADEVIGDVPPVENTESDIQKPVKNINSADESVKNDDSAGLNVPTVHEPAQTLAPITTRYTKDQITTIKNTVAKGISDSELEMFIHISQVYGLDPFLKEIFYSPQMKTIMTSRDGYLKVAQRDRTFKGIQSMGVCENDDFEIDIAGHTVKHKFGKGDRGAVIGGWAIVSKTGRDPVIAYADIREYRKDNSVWKTYPSAMICKVAEAFALKRQFGISGLITREEME